MYTFSKVDSVIWLMITEEPPPAYIPKGLFYDESHLFIYNICLTILLLNKAN